MKFVKLAESNHKFPRIEEWNFSNNNFEFVEEKVETDLLILRVILMGACLQGMQAKSTPPSKTTLFAYIFWKIKSFSILPSNKISLQILFK